MLGIDLAREPVPVEDRLRDDPWRDAVADPVERLDALVGEGAGAGLELEVELVVRAALRDQDDGVRLQLDRLAELVRGSDAARLDRGHGRADPPAGPRPSAGAARRSGPSSVSSQVGAMRSCGVTSSTEWPSPASFSASPAAMK